MTQLRQQAIKSVFWVGATKSIGHVLSLSVTVVLMRILSPKDYGLIGMAMVYQSVLIIIYDLGIGQAVLQKDELTEEDIHSAFWFSVSSGVILYLLTWYIAILCGMFFSNEKVVSVIRVLAISIVFLSIHEIPYCMMARKFEFKKRGFAELLSGVVCIATSLVMALKGFGVWSLVVGQVLRDMILCLLILLFVRWKIRFCFSLYKLKKMLRYGLPITGHSVIEYMKQNSDIIIIGRFLGLNSLGYYQVAMSLAKMPIQKVIIIANKVTFPVFARLQTDEKMMRRYFYKIINLISIFAFPVFLGIFSVSEEIIMLILSPKWLPSLFLLRIFCFWGILRSFTGFFLIILKATGKAGLVFKYSVYSSIFLPIGFLIAVNYGLKGIAVCWMICFPILFLYLLWLVKIEINITFNETMKNMVHPMLASLIMLCFVYGIKLVMVGGGNVTFQSMSVGIATGVTIFIGYFLLFSPETFRDLRNIGKDLVA